MLALTLAPWVRRPSATVPLQRKNPPERGFRKCRRRDSNPRHADYDRGPILRWRAVWRGFVPEQPYPRSEGAVVWGGVGPGAVTPC
jgi:hypothetical protein